MCTILRPQGGTLNASSHQNLSLAVRFMDKEASVGEIVCTEMAQNYIHLLCVVESELFFLNLCLKLLYQSQSLSKLSD